MMLWKCCTQYASKSGKLSSGHRTGKDQCSFQSQRKVMPKNVQATVQLQLSHMLATHSSVLAWRIPGTGEPGGLLSMGSHGVRHDWSALAAHASKVMLKILQARLQQYMTCEFPDVQVGFRESRGTRDQIANICWVIKKAQEFQKNINFCFIDYAKSFDCVDHNKLWKILQELRNQTTWPASWEICMQVKSNS